MHTPEFPKEIAALILDFDDVILNNKPGGPPGHSLHERAMRAAFQVMGAKHDIEDLQNLSAVDSLRAFLDAPYHTHESAAQHLYTTTLDLINKRPDVDYEKLVHDTVKEKERQYKKTLLEEGELNPGVEETLLRFADRYGEDMQAIATGSPRENVDIMMKKAERIAPLFPNHRIVAIEQVDSPKPHPQTYNLAFAALGLPEERRSSTIGLEDDPKGIKSVADAALFHTALTTRFRERRLISLSSRLGVVPNRVVDSFWELGEMFDLPKQL